MISVSETQTKDLLDQLEAFKNERVNMLQTKSLEESFKRYVDEMIEHGSFCDLARSGDELLSTATELIKTHETFKKDQSLQDRMSFIPANIADLTSGRRELVGHLNTNSKFLL
jgi:hypothetical protein